MASNKYIDKFKKGNDEYEIHAEYAETAGASFSAQTAASVNNIGKVSKYSVSPSTSTGEDKYREGLVFANDHVKVDKNDDVHTGYGFIELNSKGNFSVESTEKHLNLEAKKGVQIKPTTNVVIDSSRRILNDKGNEVHIEARFDDYGDEEYAGHDGYDEEWSQLKIHGRNMDLRCHEHGGIALQIAGYDNYKNPTQPHHENKLKFESDRISSIEEPADYIGEGGKGLEFGTFNNEHSSLYTKDYRFRGNGLVYGVTRGALETKYNSTGGVEKIDYPTQSDDFKDIIDVNNKATWNDIINAAKRCSDLERSVKEEIELAAIQGPELDVDDIVVRSNVEEIVNQAISDAHIDLTGVATEDWVLGKRYISQVAPDIVLNQYALQHAKIGKKKGNFSIDVTGKYTWEEKGPKSATTLDEHNNVIEVGDRVGDFDGDEFFEDENKVYYVAQTATTLADNTTSVDVDTIVYNSGCLLTFNVAEDGYAYYPLGEGETSYYEDPEKYLFKGKKNKAIMYNEETPVSASTTLNPSELSQEEITYYESKCPVYDVDGETIIVEGQGWEKVMIWKKKQLWAKNEININLETDSKIKFAGKKIETVWTYEENGEDVDHKMDEILLSTNSLATDANEVVFEQKISKNGDRSGQDGDIVYSFTNNVYPLSYKDFKKNYNEKHTPKEDDELRPMHEAFVAEGPSFEIRVKVSELLGLVARVRELEERVAALENQSNGE